MSLRTENKIILYPEYRCRICLEATNGKIALNQTINYKKAEISLNELLEFCVNAQVCENGKADGLCLACMEKGIVCYEFKKKFAESQSILLKEIEEGDSFVIKTEVDLKEEDLVEITENEVLKEEILNDDVLVVATENGVLQEEISDEVLTENDEILKEEILDEKVQITETIKCHEDKQDILNTASDKPTANKLEHSSLQQENTAEVCEKTFKLGSTRRHTQKVAVVPKRMSCPTCGRIIFKIALKAHILTHSGEKPFPCEFCGRSFSQRGNLAAHRLIHTGETHKCSECGKGFTQKAALRSHLVGHSAERPFKCTICTKSFKFNGVMKKHMVVHTDVKNYVCEFCKKTFKRSSSLRVHRKIHTGETPHICEVCGKGFIQLYSLKKHLNTHSPDTN